MARWHDVEASAPDFAAEDTAREAYPLFLLDIERVVRVKLDGSPPHLLVQTWRPGRPLDSAFAD